MKKIPLLLWLIPAVLATGCEGFKRLTLYNDSNTTAKVTIKPGAPPMETYQLANYPAGPMADSVTVYLPAGNAYVLVSRFTGLMFNVRIGEEDLLISYVRIETEKDTIVAASKSEIIGLLKDKRTKYDKRTDKNKGLIRSRNFGNIIIRK